MNRHVRSRLADRDITPNFRGLRLLTDADTARLKIPPIPRHPSGAGYVLLLVVAIMCVIAFAAWAVPAIAGVL